MSFDSMKTIWWVSLLLGLLAAGSCCAKAVTNIVAGLKPVISLPADVNINQDAGCGGLLFVTLRLEGGEELPFIVDTGSPITLFDKSLEPKLGKRLWSGEGWSQGGWQEYFACAAPKLCLGDTRLVTGTNVFCNGSA